MIVLQRNINTTTNSSSIKSIIFSTTLLMIFVALYNSEFYLSTPIQLKSPVCAQRVISFILDFYSYTSHYPNGITLIVSSPALGSFTAITRITAEVRMAGNKAHGGPTIKGPAM